MDLITVPKLGQSMRVGRMIHTQVDKAKNLSVRVRTNLIDNELNKEKGYTIYQLIQQRHNRKLEKLSIHYITIIHIKNTHKGKLNTLKKETR